MRAAPQEQAIFRICKVLRSIKGRYVVAGGLRRRARGLDKSWLSTLAYSLFNGEGIKITAVGGATRAGVRKDASQRVIFAGFLAEKVAGGPLYTPCQS